MFLQIPELPAKQKKKWKIQIFLAAIVNYLQHQLGGLCSLREIVHCMQYRHVIVPARTHAIHKKTSETFWREEQNSA